MFGRVVHYAFDAVLLSAFLAGVRRSTGLTVFTASIMLYLRGPYGLTQPSAWDPRPSFNQDKVSESKEVKRWIDNYLGMGEWMMDNSIAIMGSSGWFERKR